MKLTKAEPAGAHTILWALTMAQPGNMLIEIHIGRVGNF